MADVRHSQTAGGPTLLERGRIIRILKVSVPAYPSSKKRGYPSRNQRPWGCNNIELSLVDAYLQVQMHDEAAVLIATLLERSETGDGDWTVRDRISLLDVRSRRATLLKQDYLALDYALDALDLCDHSVSKVSRANQENTVGENYRRLGHVEKAVEYYQRSYET